MREDPIAKTMKYLNYWQTEIDARLSELQSRARSGEDIKSLGDMERGVFTEFRANDSEHERAAQALYLAAGVMKFGFPVNVVHRGYEHERSHNREAKRQYGNKVNVSYGVTFPIDKRTTTKLGLRAARIVDDKDYNPIKEAKIALAPKDPSESDLGDARSYGSNLS